MGSWICSIHCFWHCSCRTYFCCFSLALADICPRPLLPFFQISLKKKWTQNRPQYLSGLSRALYLTTFLEIAVYRVHTSLYVEERFTGGVYYFFLFHERTRGVDQSVRLSRAPVLNPLSVKIRVWARTSRVCQRATFSPLILGWGTFWNVQLYMCLPCGLDFSVLWFEKRVFSGNKDRLTGLVLHVVFWVLGLQLLVAYD